MADKNMTPPPMNRNCRGPMFRPREKPKNLKGTLLRLWNLTKGQRKGLGWILLLSALTSASAILSPFVIGQAVTALMQVIRTNDFAAIACIICKRLACPFFTTIFMVSIGQRMIRYIRNSLFDSYEKLPLAFLTASSMANL
ncbi:MAG: hypothetical protein ACLSCV_00720 [Acutalibacteraceae bacterium]